MLACVGVWGARPGHAQPLARLTVEALDATGAPLPGATVIAKESHTRRDGETGRDGRLTFDALPPGQYALTATLEGFAPVHRTAYLPAGQSVTLSFTLWLQGVDQTMVTAARVGARDVQSLPMAVTALPSRDLQTVQVHTVEQLAGLTPSFTFSQNTGFAQVTIRGIGTNAVFAGSDPSSAVYVDGVYLARPAAMLNDFVALERVEVLRGPQGTLYGRNAVGGAINVVTRMPTNELEASARVDVGTAALGRVEARVSGPILRNRLLGSAAFLRGVRDGFVRDLTHPGRPLGGEDVTAGRGKLLVVLNRHVDLLLSGDVTHRDAIPMVYAKVLAVKPAFAGRVDNPADLHDVRTSVAAAGDTLQHGESALLTARLAPGTTLTSLTAYRTLDDELLVDGDITELDLTISNVLEQQHQVTQELTIAREGSRLSWLGGLFLLHEDDRQPTYVTLSGDGVQTRLEPRVRADSRAAFGQATFRPAPRWALTAGARYTDEAKTIDNAGELVTLATGQPVPGTDYAYNDAIAHGAWTPKVGAEFHAGAATLVYASAARGFKSGGFNFSSPEPGRGYAPEWAWSYEGGLKAVVGRGRAHVNVAAFFTDYTNLQVQTAIRPGVLDISNAAEATIRGVELEAAARLRPDVEAGGHVAWLDARYDRYTAVGVGGITGDAAGRRLSNAPEWAGRTWIEWRGRVRRPGGTLSLRADGRWQTTVYYTPLNDAIQRQRPYGLLDVSATLDSGLISVGAYARNLTNQDHITGAFGSPQPAFGGRPGDARQIGVQLTVRR